MLEQHEVAAYLLTRRLVRRRSIVSGSLRISDTSSRNRNFRVSGRAGESLLLKQGIVADSAASLANEAALYRRLTAADRAGSALAACVPRLHGHDRRRGILILEWIAGAAWALLELYAATGDARHRAAAERALDYERHWFDPAQADWPDLRGIERREPRGAFAPPYATGWCHGAAGIALSRLRAWRILGDDALRAEALTALTTTAAQTERALLAPRADFTLCHGLAGHGDVLLLGAELLPEGAALARRVAEVGVGRYATSLDGWPCGSGRTPAMLTGDAGVGLFLLRVRDATVPSVLLTLATPG